MNTRAFGNTPQAPEQQNVGELGVPEEAANPEEQAMYDAVVSRARNMIFGKNRDQVLRTMSVAETPAQGMGTVAARIAQNVRKAAGKKGTTVDDEVMRNAGAEVIEDLSELGQSAGVFEFDSQDEADTQVQEAMMWAMKIVGEDALSRGEIDQGGAQSYMDELVQPNQVAQGVQQGIQPPAPSAPPVSGPPAANPAATSLIQKALGS